MSIINQVAYLPTSRNFPIDQSQLTQELDKSYIDIANAVNNRTIGLFPTNFSAINGESWFLNGRRQQGLRQIYQFTSFASIPHGLNFNSIAFVTRIYGTFLSPTSPIQYFPIPYVDIVAANQIGIAIQAINNGNIVFNVGGGAPAITSGIVVIEWISNI